MEDPLLSTLCKICHINPPQYTCPRCFLQTCSLPCSRRHKVWSSCNGIRDPTVYKPMSQLATPLGIDHDYNFLHSIEHGIERSEKRIVEEKGLIRKEELELARRGEDPNIMRKIKVEKPGEHRIRMALQSMGITVEYAPKGMKRNVENGTCWNKNQKSIWWQVEWIREGDESRLMSKVIGNKPIGDMYAAALEEDRRRHMTSEEKTSEKKRKAMEMKARQAKRRKLDEVEASGVSIVSAFQSPQTGAWSLVFPSDSEVLDTKAEDATRPMPNPKPHFYLHRPRTQSSFPTVLVPIESSKSLNKILQRRLLLEFPTIYVFGCAAITLPEGFMLEKDYLISTGQKPWQDSDTEMAEIDESDESESESEENETGKAGIGVEDETSSSGSDDDESEQGEHL